MTVLSLLGHGGQHSLVPLLLIVLVTPSYSFQPLLQPSSLLRKTLVSSAKAPRSSCRLASSLRAANDFSKYSVTKVECYRDGVAQVREHNHRLVSHFQHLRKQEYFRLFAVDLLSSCTYMPTADMPCEMDRCEIESAEDVREDLRIRDAKEHSFRLDGWVRWDMPGDFTEYYDIYEEGERYTGYDGKRVWDFIHDRICFQVEVDDPENAWKRDFNRAVSGLHTSVSSHVLLSMRETEGLTEEQEMAEYQRRIAQVPEAVGNLYFAYMIMLCAIQHASNRLNNCSYMGAKEEVLPSITAVTGDPLLTHPAVQKAAQAMRNHARSPSAKVWKARLRTRDLLGIMNCVQCNLCRLHGKVASLGLAVALGVLLGNEGEGGNVEDLHRVEIAALISQAAKFANAVEYVNSMERKLAAAAKV